MIPTFYYEVAVGIVRFPPDKQSRFLAYKALSAGYGIRLSRIESFGVPYYVNTFVFTGDEEHPEVPVLTSLKDHWDYLDENTMLIHKKMLQILEEVGCKMIYVPRDRGNKEKMFEIVPEEYLEDLVCNIDWFKTLMW